MRRKFSFSSSSFSADSVILDVYNSILVVYIVNKKKKRLSSEADAATSPAAACSQKIFLGVIV